MKKIEEALDRYVRPLLFSHGGDIEVISFQDGIVRFRFQGVCSGCAAADLTAEELVSKELQEHVPGVKRAILETRVSEELFSTARKILETRHAR